MATKLLNPSDSLVNPVIVHSDGRRDTLNIQPRGRVTVPAGWTLDQNWYAQNATTIKVFDVA